MSNPATQALGLLRHQMTLADLNSLTTEQRQELAAMLHHWLMLLQWQPLTSNELTK